MVYYCFFCNKTHIGSHTKEHFIPKSMDVPEDQWLPACSKSNARSNSIFDSNSRDILYLTRHLKTGTLKRQGEALLSDGSLKQFKFSYSEGTQLEDSAAFNYIHDIETNMRIPSEHIYGIKFQVGLSREEQETFCRGLAKISIGAIAYLLKKEGVKDSIIRKIFMQPSIDALRHCALNLPWSGEAVAIRFPGSNNDVLGRLQRFCKNQRILNHVVRIIFHGENSIRVEGMLYSRHSWILDLPNQIPIEAHELRLENPIAHMEAPESLKDISLSSDSVCLLNPDFKGKKPNIPQHWKNK